MGEVMVARDKSIDKVLDRMKKSGFNEESAIKENSEKPHLIDNYKYYC